MKLEHLTESRKLSPDGFYLYHKDVEWWIRNCTDVHVWSVKTLINDDLSVEMSGPGTDVDYVAITTVPRGQTHIPVKLTHANNCVLKLHADLTSYKGLPQQMRGLKDSYSRDNMSWNGFPRSVEEYWCNKSDISQMYKHCGRLGALILTNIQDTTSLLGVLRIASLNTITVSRRTQYNRRTLQAVYIINDFLPSRDILGCQEALIEAGLSEFAKL